MCIQKARWFASAVSTVALLAVAGAVFAKQEAKDMYKQHNEKLGDPYLPGYGFSGPSDPIVFGAFTSVQVNTNSSGNNIVNDAANEPSLAVNPLNPLQIVVGWRQFDNKSSNFRQAGNAYSSNGGKTWTNRPVFTPGTFRSDPVLQCDANGTFYYLSLQQTFFCDIFKSTNGGVSWTGPLPAVGGDKQWFNVDKTNSVGKGYLYQIWSTAGNNYGGRQFSRSTNGSTSWMNPINITNSPIWGTVDIGINGEVYLSGSNGGSQFYFVRSSNAKNSGQTPTWDLVRTVNLGGSITFGGTPNPGGLLGQCWLRSDRTSPARKGWLYMLCSVDRGGSNPCDVMFSRSTNGGSTWSAPLRINDDPTNGNKFHWFGTMGLAPNGRLDVIFNDTRHDASGTTSKLMYTCSYDGGTTWYPNTVITPAFNSLIGWPNQDKIGDYYDIHSDDKGANVIYSATFNGEQDVYFVRIPAPPIKSGGGIKK